MLFSLETKKDTKKAFKWAEQQRSIGPLVQGEAWLISKMGFIGVMVL